MKYGLSEKQLREITQILASYKEAEEAILFGSRAKGTHKEASDVDIVIKGKNVTYSFCAKLKSHLEDDTYLPYFFDIIAYNTISSDELKEHIRRYGKTIVGGDGTVPDGWIETTLGEVCEIKYGKDHKQLNKGDIPCYGSGGLMRKVDAVLYNKPSVLIPRKGTLSNLFFINEPFWTVDTLFYTKIDSKKVTPLFLFYKLKTYNLESLNVGSAVPSLTTAVLNQFFFSIPKDIEEQKSIADILSSFDNKIELLQAQNKTLETTAQTIFKEWFGKYQIGDELPEGWRVIKIKDFDVIVTDYVANGSFASLAQNVTYRNEPDYAKLIRLTDYNNGFNGMFVYVDKKAYNFLNKSKLVGGEIIISNVGAYAGTVFKCPMLNSPMTLGPNSIVLKSDFNNYFYQLFKSRIGEHFLSSIITGSAQPKFNKTAFRNLELSFPNIKYLVDFEFTVTPFMEKIEQNNAQIQTLQQTRDTLLPKLMSGQLRVEGYKDKK